MNSLIHALNIGTLAAWLSVLGFGTVGVLLPGGQAPRTVVALDKLATLTVTAELTLDDDSLSDSSPPSAATPPAMPNTLPAPPALPEIASVPPLPEVPDLPDTPKVSPATRAAPQATASRTPRAATAEKPGTAAQPSSAMAGKDRIAAGRMPAPDYPPVARRNHQEGTVVVQFSVNSSGRVTAAFAKSPSPWPLLNEAAVRTVRKWSFPPGAEITLDRPIVFRLN